MSSAFHMIDVSSKAVTLRRAVAGGEIKLSAEVCRAIAEKRVPKGDVLALAEIAGIAGAKQLSNILPLCHPLPLDAVEINCELNPERAIVTVQCAISAHGRTGVEMEALGGASAALLCIYDLTKSLDKGAVISSISLISKSGGRSGNWEKSAQAQSPAAELQGLRAGIVVTSDRCAAGLSADQAGPLLAAFLKERGAEIVESRILPDEADQIRNLIQRYTQINKLDLVLVSGGTGPSPRDVTPEALERLWTKMLPGFGEAFRSRGLTSTPHAWLSRAEAGLIERTLVVLLPGSLQGVRDGLEILAVTLPHLISVIGGAGH